MEEPDMASKNRSARRLLIGGVALLALAACSKKDGGELFEVGAPVTPAKKDPALVEQREIAFNAEALKPGGESALVLTLPAETLTINVTPMEPAQLGLPANQQAWSGRMEDGSELYIMRIGKGYEARLARGKSVYRIRSVDGQTGFLETYDATRFQEAPNDGVRGPESPTGGPSGDSSCLDAADRIDIMAIYTPQARDSAGGVTEIENEIAFAIGVTNLAYANSNAAHRLNLIYVGLADYSEPGAGVPSNALLGDLQGTADGVLDTVHGTRDSVKADLVSLFYEVDDSTWCGWGHTVENANADTTDHRAFTVVKRSCASGNLSFPHEVGHNLGAQHDRDTADPSTLGYNFGHTQPAPTSALAPWRTVMSYSNPCGTESATGFCSRVAWFSNPDVSRSGDPTGVALTEAEPEHNVNAFALNDSHVARYRCLQQDIAGADVWMKDRWEDTGDEPDPATAGMAMWQSPYIWVRRSEDTTLEHEHEHQDPYLDINNHVYVKMHNDGGAAQTGDLELYYASASTNLNDPSNWTPIGTQNQTLSPGVEVFHFTWSGLPGEGHYCLLARWNEGGTPLSFTNINDAVRNDNDLIWRNVNIVDLSGDIDDSAGDFMMAGDRRFEKTFLVLDIRPKKDLGLDWQRLVEVTMTLDPAVLAADSSIQGLKALGPGQYRVQLTVDGKGTQASIGPFLIPAGKTTKVDLDFKVERAAIEQARKTLANPAYLDITASQLGQNAPATTGTAASSNTNVLGGVTFTLKLPPPGN
jgi:hypothetical protein